LGPELGEPVGIEAVDGYLDSRRHTSILAQLVAAGITELLTNRDGIVRMGDAISTKVWLNFRFPLDAGCQTGPRVTGGLGTSQIWSNSRFTIPSRKASHSAWLNLITGPLGFLLSRTPVLTSSTRAT